ncbi:HD domain-containing protein [Candidatus Dojkabacteria bacterium]|nr:HD domain-containing protein [Candidatus Dojkabacteria bacterium]
MRKLTKEQEAIELGKVWMKKSKDPTHDYGHAQRVTQNALKVFEELKENQPERFKEIDPGLVKLLGWWHDCYKARFEKASFRDLFIEGRESELIFRDEMKNYLKPERLEKVAYAISNHQKVFLYVFRFGKIPPLLRIIFEADGLDAMRRDRHKMIIGQNPNIFRKLFSFGMHQFMTIFYKLFLPFTEYGRNTFKRNKAIKPLNVPLD